ncbi:MAG: hypothetical protein AB7S26_38225 [Sandaracinaceae bacterium]
MSARQREPRRVLIARAAGSPREMAKKAAALARGIATYANGRALDERMRRLERIGQIERAPNRVQLVVGSIDMLRFWISPAAAEYYEAQGIDYGFHQLLRILDDPSSMIDPTGFLSARDTIIGHLMQVVHANPAYDLQLLESHEDGLLELERQLERMLDGTHPRARSIGAIVEEPDYHARLLAYVKAYRERPDVDAPLRDNVEKNPRWALIARTFGTLPNAMRYFAKLPDEPLAAAWHVLSVREFPVALAS